MEENHQDKTERERTITVDKLWLPPLSPQAQKKLDRLRKNRKKARVIGISAAFVGVIALVYIGFRLNWSSQEEISMPYWMWVLILLIPIGIILLILLIRKNRKKARVIGISAAFVGVIALVYIGFRLNWSSRFWISMPYWMWVLILLIPIGIVLLILLIRVGHTPQWTGFKGKTLWDWLQFFVALAIPITIAFGTAWFSYQQNQTSNQIANDQQQEAALETYLDRMSDLLLNNKLSKSKPGDEIRAVAQARTLTILDRINPDLRNGLRKGTVLRFLYEAHLINEKDTIISLVSANLSGAQFDVPTNLSGANLSGADLSGADFSGQTDLTGSNLSRADLDKANLSGASLGRANLSEAFLWNADLSFANLSSANLSSADLYQADLWSANLSGAILVNADLARADLTGHAVWTNLQRADLSGADLEGAYVRKEQLDEAKSLKGATMPDGSIHP